MIPNFGESIFYEVSRIEFAELENRLSQLEVTDDDHFDCESYLQTQILELKTRVAVLERSLTEVTKICLKVTTFLATTYKKPVGDEEIDILTAALNRLTITKELQ